MIKHKKILGCILLGMLSLFGWVKYQQSKILVIGTYSTSSWDVPSNAETKVIDDVIKRFEKEYGVKVIYESGITKKDYGKWLTNKIVAGKTPDVFAVPPENFNLLASTGALKKLDQLLKTEKIATTDFYQGALAAGNINGHQYALPYESNPTMMCLNKDLLRKERLAIPQANWTTTDFLKLCQQVTKDTDQNGTLDQFGCVNYTWQQASAAENVQLFNENGTKANFNTSQVAQAIKLVEQLEQLNGNQKVTTDDFDKGNVAFVPMTLAQYRTYKAYPYHIARYSTFSWTCVPMPQSAPELKSTPAETAMYGISAKTKQTKLAVKFLKLLCADKKTQTEVFEKSQGAPVLKSVVKQADSKKVLEKNNFGKNALTPQVMDSMLQNISATPKFKKYDEAMQQADILIQQGLVKQDVNLNEIQLQLDELLNK